MIPFIWNFQKGQIYKDKKKIHGFLGLEVGVGLSAGSQPGLTTEWHQKKKKNLEMMKTF